MLNYFFIVVVIVFLILLLFVYLKQNKKIESFVASQPSGRPRNDTTCRHITNPSTCRSISVCRWNTSNNTCNYY